MRHTPARTVLGLGIAAMAVSVAGCAAVSGSESQTPVAGESSGAEAPSPSPTATTSSASSEPAGPESPTPASSSTPAPAGLAGRLLTAADMPSLRDGSAWEEAGTGRSEGEPFGTCHKYAMTSIGAVRVVVRSFQPAGSAGSASTTAGHLVAQFPDETTAQRATQVLRSWHDRCAEELSAHDRRNVGGLEPVSLDDGEASWFLLGYGPVTDDAGETGDYADVQAFARVGTRVSVLKMRELGPEDAQGLGRSRERSVTASVRLSATKLG